jgi:hypothetical protein
MIQTKLRIIILFISICLNLQAQESKRDYDTENDNWTYFYDIAVENGVYNSIGHHENGSMFSASGSYFYNDKFGFRSGISLITGMEASDKYWKMPVLFAFRTKTFKTDWGEPFGYSDDIGYFFLETLTNVLVRILPTRFEFNAGPSFGYLTPEYSSTYTYQGDQLILAKSVDARSRFASSLDANMRMSFQFWRICLNVNMGSNWLWTRNYEYTQYLPAKRTEKPSWFLNFGAGASFRF